jgi:glycosyltransferase involved in cell wall biosynthesis
VSKINEFPLVSVITVCFNAAHFIEQTIRSVLSQTYPYIEYIIIDGGSTDGTAEVIRKFESRLAYYHSKPDRGLAHAFNLGLAQTHGDWIMYLNADDFFLDNQVIERMAPHLIINQAADVVFGKIMSVAREKTPIPLPLTKIYRGNSWRWQEFRWDDTIPHQAAFTNRKYFEKVGYFNESLRIVIDYELFLRAGEHLKAKFIPITISAMRVGGLSLSKDTTHILRLRREYRQVQQKAAASPEVLCWLNFYWRIIRYFLLRAIHKVLDPYASKVSLKGRMSGNSVENFNTAYGVDA